METKQVNEEKEAVIKDLETKNQEIIEQLEALSKDKERADKDLEDLMDEFVIVKEKLEDGNNSLKDKDRQLNELKKKAPNTGKETPRKIENERIPESNEEVEELKEKLEQREKIITELKAHVDSLSVENTREEDFGPLSGKLSDLGIKLRELKSIMFNLSAKSDRILIIRLSSNLLNSEDRR
jgi:chromosome segregation ATPase